jgi:RNA polymerase sigma factor (sigma-70 family)
MEASAPPRPRGALRSPERLRTSGDAELVRLVRLGHEPAFEQIYDRHHRGILSFCRHMLGSRDEAEDAVQHTFIAAYRDLRGSDKPIHLKAWLYTIARNRCLSMLRARREQVAIEDAEPSTDGLAAEVQRRQDLRDMLRDLRRLPDDQREALVLSELGALSHEEIAMTLGVRKEKIKALVFQARESLASSRQARDADCREIQQQLSILRGGSLRRTQLRRHVESCSACQAFKEEVQRQRAAMAVLLPVVPSAGLKSGVLAGALSAGAVGGAAGGGAVAGGIGAKLIVGAVLVGGSVGGGIMAIDELRSPPASSADDRNGAQARILGFPGAGYTDKAGRPAEGGARAVVDTLRERAAAVAQERAVDRQSQPLTAWGATGDKTVPDALVTLVVGAIGDLAGDSGADAARKPKKARGDKRGGAGPKKARKPKVPQHYGAQGKGNAYGRGREPAAGNGQGSPGGGGPARSSGPKQEAPAGGAPKGSGGGGANAQPRPGGPSGSGSPAAAGPRRKSPKPKRAPVPVPVLPAPSGNAGGGNGNGNGNGDAKGHEKRSEPAHDDPGQKGYAAVDAVTEAAGSLPETGEPPVDPPTDGRSLVAALLGFV